MPRNPHGLAVDVVLLVVDTVDELLVDELLVDVDVGGGADVEVVGGGAIDVVVDPCGGFVVVELVDVEVVDVELVDVELVDVEVVVDGLTVLLVDVVDVDVLDVGGRLLVVVGMVGAFVVEVLAAGLVVVVVVLVSTTRDGHAVGAGAFRATKRPGLSLPMVPPKRRQ